MDGWVAWQVKKSLLSEQEDLSSDPHSDINVGYNCVPLLKYYEQHLCL